MRKKGWKRRVTAMLVALAMAFTTVLASGIGQIEAKADVTNLLANGDFEADNLYDWTFTCEGVSYSVAKWDGMSSNHLVLNNATSSASNKEVSLTQTISELPAGTYELSVSMAGTVTSGFNVIKDGIADEDSWTENRSTDWNVFETYVVSITVESDKSDYVIGLNMWLYPDDNKSILLDDISLVKTDESDSDTEDDSDSADTSDAIIKNGGFETGNLDNWSFECDNESATATVAEWAKKSGNYGLVLKNPWVDENSASQEVKLTQTISTLPAGTYELSVSMAGTTAASESFTVIRNGESDTTWNSNVSTGWNTFQTYTFDITVETDQSNYKIGFDMWLKANSEQGMLLDDISLVKVEKITCTDLIALISKVPIDYETAGFETETLSALKSALESAKNVTAENTDAEIKAAYDALKNALDNLKYSDETISVQKVDGLNERTDFIKGVDISSYISEVNSGVVYKNQAGQEVTGKEFLKTFAEVGINYIRLRVWNAPYDLVEENKLYYGGGNNDIDTTVEICKIIKEYNDAYGSTYGEMKVLVDLQYSDFWADPDKQTAPKAWATMDINAKTEAVKEFTKDCIAKVEATGVTVGMVQIGNETNTGICGTIYETADYISIFKAGCDAVKEYNASKRYTTENGKWIKRVVHFTDPQSASTTFAKTLKDGEVDYDVYATSYYPFWHGTPENLKNMLSAIADACKCEVMVAETQYVYTNKDYDGADNQAYEGKENIDLSQWPVSVQGQATEIRDVINAVAGVGDAGIGMFYWEPGWLGVGNAYNLDGTLNETALAANKEKWNTYGSGWASDYAKTYDEQAAKWGGGGTNNENASLFDFTGKPLASLNVFKYVNYGAVAAQTAFYAADAMDTVVVTMGSSANTIKGKLPTSVGFSYNDGSKDTADITWNTDGLTALATTISKTSAIGNYYLVEGTITVNGANHKVTCEILVDPKENLLTNGGFENPNSGEWIFKNGKVLWRATADCNDKEYYNKDANPRNGSNGSVILNTYNSAEEDADDNDCYSDSMSQTVTVPAGVYEAKGFFEGLDKAGSRTGENISISVSYGDGKSKTSNLVVLDTWMKWKSATVSNVVITDDMVKAGTNKITVSVNVCLEKSTWGSVDDIYLYQTGTYTPPTNSYTGSYGGGSSSTTTDDKTNDTTTEDSTSADSAPADNTTVTENPDGTTTETKTQTAENEAGNTVETTVTTEKDKDGNITGSSEVSVIEKAASKTSATVTVSKDADGNVTEATADVTTVGTTSGKNVVGSISGKVVSQITEAAGDASVEITVNVTNSKGKTKYTITADSEDLTAGNKLKVVAVDSKTGEYVLVNSKTYTVTKAGSVKVTLASGKDYELLTTKEAAAVEKAVLATVKVKKTSATVKPGKTTTVQMSSKLNMDNVASITYTSSKKTVATVNKNGKVTAKKAGTVTIKATVTLNNGATKKVTMKIKVKK